MEESKIEQLYKDKKSKGFVNHLIQSYMPYKISKVWNFKKDQKHKCNICGHGLFSIEDYFEGFYSKQNELYQDMGEFLKKSVNGEELKREDHPIVKHIIGDKILGWTGQNTDTTLCQKCINDILNLVQKGILKDDKNIIWLTNKMQRTEFFNQFKNSKLSEKDKKETSKIHKKIENKKATFADLGVLQEIKEKLVKESKKPN